MTDQPDKCNASGNDLKYIDMVYTVAKQTFNYRT